MRKLIRRPELIPAERRTGAKKPNVPDDDDRMFINVLKAHHRKQKFQYMRGWWEKFNK